MKRIVIAAAAASLAIAGAFSAVALTAGNTSATTVTGAPAAAVSGYMKGAETLIWQPVQGAPGYDLYLDGAKVSNAGPNATSAKFSVQPGQHTLQAIPQASVVPPSTSSTTAAVSTAPTTTAVTTTAPTTTSTPPPSISNPLGVIRLGNDWSTATGYQRYGTVIVGVGNADDVAKLPSTVKRLVYMSAIDLPTFFAGVNYQEALANGYTLAPEGSNGTGAYLLDPGNTAYQKAFIQQVGDFLRQHHLDGFYMDDVVTDPRSLTTCNCWPAKYPNGNGWVSAMQSFVHAVGPALKAQGFYVGANAIAYFPGNVGAWPGTNSDNGTTDQYWAKQLAPDLSFLMFENFEYPNALFRNSGTTVYPANWGGYRQVEDIAQAAGADFYATVEAPTGTAPQLLYSFGTQLLDWDGNGGGILLTGGGDPWNAATWARQPGAALEPAIQVGQMWRRRFANFTVYVNPTTSSQSADGVTLPATSAIFK